VGEEEEDDDEEEEEEARPSGLASAPRVEVERE
jgi:hypothetical protein